LKNIELCSDAISISGHISNIFCQDRQNNLEFGSPESPFFFFTIEENEILDFDFGDISVDIKDIDILAHAYQIMTSWISSYKLIQVNNDTFQDTSVPNIKVLILF
jgi:hypothetical protein